MRILSQIDIATRLTRAGKLAEALAALTGGHGVATTAKGWTTSKPVTDPGPTLRAALDAGLGGTLGRLGTPLGFKGRQVAPPPVPEGASFTERRFVSSAGALTYKLYVPRRAGPEPLPLVVMLHGCTQSPDDFATGTRMNERAEADGVYVAYPAQSQAANPQKCWNWFRAVDQGRHGEPALIASMVHEILRSENVDPARVYVAGLSAGGAAAAVLGQNYPELFAAVGVHSGLACGAAADMPSAFAAMRSGAVAPPGGAAMPTVVFHGDRDATVAPINGAQVLAQAGSAEHLTATVDTDTAPGGLRYTRTVQTDATGRPLFEHWVLHEGGHAWSGGDPAGSYSDPRGPDASLAMLRFFSHHRRGERS